jgi:1-acyl-sn-glycerol-3-phosphate acyltransferase
MLSALGNHKAKLVLFPEGHRISEGEAASAKAGAIVLASHSGVPLLPVYIPRKKRLFRYNKVVIGEAYTTGKIRGTERERVTDELMQKISALGNIS